jgi:hypothetical protein
MSNNYDDMIKQLRGEFIDEVEDNISEIELVMQRLRSGQETHKDAIIKIRRLSQRFCWCSRFSCSCNNLSQNGRLY